jgi:hypothetical protein
MTAASANTPCILYLKDGLKIRKQIKFIFKTNVLTYMKNHNQVRFEILAVVTIENTVFCGSYGVMSQKTIH